MEGTIDCKASKRIRLQGMCDNVCQLLFRIAHIKTAFYKTERDISSPSYIAGKRIIYDNINYDELK